MHYHAERVNDFPWSAEIAGEKHPVHKETFSGQTDLLISKILSHKWLPSVGYNEYDGFQIGILHRLTIADDRVTTFFSPMFGTASKRPTGFFGVNMHLHPGKYFREVTLGVNGSMFSDQKGSDSVGRRIVARFGKVAPFVKVSFPGTDRHTEQTLELKTFIIGESDFDYVRYSVDSFYYPVRGQTKVRYLNQLTFRRVSHRSLYPYDAQLQVQQASDFYRINAEAHYFFNYAKGGGMRVRLFAAKFGYIGNASSSDTYRYQPKLTAVRGNEDYTYGDAFIGRNEFAGFASQQIMMRDGGLKVRTDMFQDLQGRSDNWVASMNFNTTLPAAIFPPNFPVRLFLDVGTYAGAWKEESSLPRFLYVSGLQLSLLKNTVNIYAPVMYSNEFRNSLKTVPEESGFFKTISFSLDFNSFITMFMHKS